jgi:hypothetical protein
MPAIPRKNNRRQGQLSCEFCRSRKVRCNRVQPCSNCSVRGIDCAFLIPPGAQSSATIVPSHAELLQRIERLEGQLNPSQGNGVTPFDVTQSGRYPVQVQDLIHIATPTEHQALASADGDTQILENIGTREEQVAAWSSELNFRQQTTQDILQSSHSVESRTVAFPEYRVASLLRQNYEANLDSMCKIIHIPSLRSTLEGFYLRLHEQGVDPGLAALFLSLFALSAFFYPSSQQSDVTKSNDEAVKLSRALAKSALDVLDHCRRMTAGSLEEVQAYMLMTFVVWQHDGFSARGRSYLAAAASIARDIGLHRLDEQIVTGIELTHRMKIDREMKRRIFWYVASADW